MKKAKKPPARMTAPRRPRGEKPITTIRLLRRQLATAQLTVDAMQRDRTDKEAVIAGYDVQLHEANDEIVRLIDRTYRQAEKIGQLNKLLKQTLTRLSFLEGYHARAQENLLETRRLSLETLARTGFGDPRSVPADGQDAQGARPQEGSSRLDATLDREIRRDQAASMRHPAGQASTRRPVPSFTKERAPQASPETEDPFGLTEQEIAFLAKMELDDADNQRATRPRTPYRGVDGPLY